ncbi:MAG: sulfatase [Planctomycetaceae bacterium]
MRLKLANDLCPVLRHSFVTRLASAVVAMVILCSGIENASAESHRPPNIVLILADDLGWADLGCYGADLHETPHLDRLARDGMRFTNAYASAPICSPTRAAIMTGQYPARLHMTIWREAAKRPVNDRKLVPPEVEENLPHDHAMLLPQLLHKSGYATAHIGKWHLGDASYYPEAFGFDFHLGGNHWGAPATYFYPYRGPFSREKEQRYVPGLHWGKKGEYLTDRLTDEAIQFIERAENPFFLNLWHYGVHTPMDAKKQDVEYFESKLRPEMKHRNPTYAAMLRSLDDGVGRIIAALKDRGLSENTVVIFTSDNGGFLGGPDRFITTNTPLRSGKGALYEGGVRVPLIVDWPGVTKPGSICHAPVASMDLHSTIRDIRWGGKVDPSRPDILMQEAELSKKSPPDGLSLVPLLKDPQMRIERDTLYWHYPHYYPTSTPCSSIRKGDMKLIEFYEDQHVELYNLKEDMSETSDLATKMPEMAKELREELHQWRKSVNAQMPTVNAAYKAK